MAAAKSSDAWRLLIYTVPSEPSRKRAFIWRELKKAGAVYLRDGVCALPERQEAAEALAAVAAKVEEFGGEATVVAAAKLPSVRVQAIIEASRAARQQEYLDVADEAERFLEHVRRETEHREFTFAELEELEADLNKLRGWFEQIRRRDYFDVQEAGQVQAVLESCEEALNAFMEEASGLEVGR